MIYQVVYLFKYLFLARKRQKILFLALSGIFISSMALLILQSTMGGLQHGLIERSKKIHGHATIEILNYSRPLLETLLEELALREIYATAEYEVEVLAKNGNYLSPVVIHGLVQDGNRPPFLKDQNMDGLIIGRDGLYLLKTEIGERLELISPTNTINFFGDLPRSVSETISGSFRSDLPKVDSYHLWTRASLLYNLKRKVMVNKIRLYSPYNYQSLKTDFNFKYQNMIRLTTWEQVNQTLLGAFKLESNVMLFLFMAMTLLVALSISSGLLIYWQNLKRDLISLWILGSSHESIKKSSQLFLILLSFFSVLAGLAIGAATLYLYDHYGPEIMPENFVDRKIPILMTAKGFIYSFSIPFIISLIFGAYTLRSLKHDQHTYLDSVRSV